ncbi:glycosyltransferase family 2 protein [Natrialbaceae archaeon A-chndr2]
MGVVVPAYNEAGFVGEVLETIPDFVDRVYVIDDRSTDGTWREILSVVDQEMDDPIDGATTTNRPAESPVTGAVTDGGATTAVSSEEREETAEQGPSKKTAVATTDDASPPDREGGVSTTDRDESAAVYSSEPRDEGDGSAGEESSPMDDGRPREPSKSADDSQTTTPQIVPIRHEVNRGVGGAIKTGYEHALGDEIDIVAVMAGDGQMDPEQLHRLLDPIVDGEAAYAKGNRLGRSEEHASMSSWRLFGNVLLTILTKVASGYWEMMDPQNGYTALSTSVLETVDLEGLYEEYGFANDLLVELNTAGYHIADVSMPAVYGDEHSHIEYRTFVPRLSSLLLFGFFRRLRRRYVVREFHPMVCLYGLGIVGWLLATAGVTRAIARRADDESGRSNSVLYGFLASICLAVAMVYDREDNDGSVVRVR